MMMIGRLLFGLGAETQIVMLNKVLAKWFMGKELALAFGLKLGMARMGSALGMSISPRVAESYGFSTSLWLGAVIMMSGLILFLIYALVDYRDEKQRGAGDAAKLAADEPPEILDPALAEHVLDEPVEAPPREHRHHRQRVVDRFVLGERDADDVAGEEGRPEGQQADHGEGDPDGLGIDREEQPHADDAAREVGPGQHDPPVETVRKHARDGRGHQERGHLQHEDD